MSESIAITGVGCVTPHGTGAEVMHEGWLAGRCAIEGGAGSCAEFDPGVALSAREVRRTDRYVQMSLVACDEAVHQAGWGDELPYDPARVGGVVATATAGQATVERELDRLQTKGPRAVASLRVLLAAPNAAAVCVAMRLGLQGECFGMVGACAGGAQAIGAGMRMIRAGELDAAVVGGADAGLTGLLEATYAGFGAISPTGTCLPFDRRRDGMVPAEGAGILVIEDAAKARARGAKILGELAGYGAGNDAHHFTMPDHAGQARTIQTALVDASLEPAQIAYVNAHGTGTRLNDPTETLALKAVLDGHARRIPTSSLKSSIGHTQGAAGAIEAIATLLALRDGVAPPTLGLEESEEGLDLDYVPLRSRRLDPPAENGHLAALTNSFGLGGHNACLALRVAVETEEERTTKEKEN
jgi:3-oxoacyl-[acyl-carrier-protein] synthase II